MYRDNPKSKETKAVKNRKDKVTFLCFPDSLGTLPKTQELVSQLVHPPSPILSNSDPFAHDLFLPCDV